MKPRLGLLRRVRDARLRLRDVAAGVAAHAAGRLRDAELVEEGCHLASQELLEAAPERLEAVASAPALLTLDDERQHAAREVELAAQRRAGAQKAADQERQRLRERERALRMSEQLLEDARKERGRRADQDEQRGSDDLSAARVARRS